MPYLTFNNLSREQIMEVSNTILDDLVRVIDCPSDWFNFIGNDSYIINENTVKDNICYVSVEWFKRNEVIEQEVAEIIDNVLKKMGYVETVIHFYELDINNYYEDAQRVNF